MSPDIDWRFDDDSGKHIVVKTSPKGLSRRRRTLLGLVVLLGVGLGVIISSVSESSPRPISTVVPSATRILQSAPWEISPAPSIRGPASLPLGATPIALLPTAIPVASVPPRPTPTLWTFFPPGTPLTTRRAVWRTWRVGIGPEPVYVVVISDTTLWAGSPFSIDRINLRTGISERYKTPEEPLLLLPVDRDQALMMGRGTLYYFDGHTWLEAYKVLNVSSLQIDKAGDLWLYASGRFGGGYIQLTGHIPPTSGDWPASNHPTASWPDDCATWTASTSLVTSYNPWRWATLRTTYVSAAECLRLRSASARVRNNRMVAVDADQSIWWATDRVLWQVTSNQPISLSLPGTQINALAADPWQGVWAGTDQGLAYSDGQTFDYPFADFNTRLFYGTPRRLAVGVEGVIWINLQDNGEVRSFSDAIPRWRHVQYSGTGVNFHGVRSIAAAPDGSFWATRGWDLWQSNDSTTLQPVTASAPPCQLRELVVDRQGHVWSPSRECGALEYDARLDQWQQHQPEQNIEAVTVAPDGHVYLLGQAGLYASSTTSDWKLIMSLRNKGAGRLWAVDRRGGVWVASRETGELWHDVDGKETALGQQFPLQGLSALYATDRLWAVDRNTLAFYAGGTWQYIPTPALGNISQLAGDPDGRIWLIGDRGVAVYDPTKDQQP